MRGVRLVPRLDSYCVNFYNSMRPHRKQHKLSLNDFKRSFGLYGIQKCFIIRGHSYVSRKTDFLPVLKNTPPSLSFNGVVCLFQRENKKRNLDGPNGRFKIPYTLDSFQSSNAMPVERHILSRVLEGVRLNFFCKADSTLIRMPPPSRFPLMQYSVNI